MFGETIKFLLNRMKSHRTEWKDIDKPMAGSKYKLEMNASL